MKALIQIHADRPPHGLIADLDGFRVDRVLTLTGKGQFAFNVSRVGLHREILKEGRVVAILSTERVEPYVGVITQLEERSSAGFVEVSGDNYASVLYNAALPVTAPVITGSAGHIARTLLKAGQGLGRSLFLEEGTLAGSTVQLAPGESLDFGTQTLGQALDDLAERTGDEWWISHRVTRRQIRHFLNFGSRGVDNASTVYFEEGKDFTDAEYRRDALGSVRSVVVVGGSGALSGRTSAAVAGQPSGATQLADRVTPPISGYTVLPPLSGKDIIRPRPTDTDSSALGAVAQRMYQNPQVGAEAIAATVTLTSMTAANVGDVVSMRFHSMNYGGLVRQVRITAAQPDESTGECELDVQVV